MTVTGILVGVLVVAVVAFNQLGGRGGEALRDPGFAYDASIVDGSALGSADAPVTLDVWEDYQCPVCARYSLEVEPSIVAEYVETGQVRIVHHDISILGRGAPADPTNESTIPAMGASCADEQDRYWPYGHWIYANQDGENRGTFDRAGVTRIAVAAGLEESAFTACMGTPEPLAHVVETTQAAADLTINSTPTFRVNGGDLIRGLLSVDQMRQLLDQALAAASIAP